jgi:hypothetical protein
VSVAATATAAVTLSPHPSPWCRPSSRSRHIRLVHQNSMCRAHSTSTCNVI